MIADPMTEQARTFISYSRKDGRAFAAELRARLTNENLSVWHDLIALEGGRDWWSQIEDVLKTKVLQHFVLVVTRAALESPVVRREIRLARQEGKTVSPVKGPGLGDLNNLPRWIGHVYDLDLPENVTTFIRVLQGPSTQKRVAMMAPEPPSDFVERPAEFQALKKRLIDAKGDAVPITAALRGAGGYGKTTLAKALAHDRDILDAYFDGILWVELGEQLTHLLPAASDAVLVTIISDLVETLSGERPGLENIKPAAAKLGDALGDRRILMLIDDAWREQDLRPFLQGGPNTSRVITTRLNRVLPQHAVRQPVDAMQDHEARELLSWGLPEDQVPAQFGAMSRLAGRLGDWAQLLKLVNGFLRERVVDAGESLRQAIVDANAQLGDEGPVGFDADDEHDEGRTKAVARTINLSLGLLKPTQRARFAELAAFHQNADIPICIVAHIWRETGGLSESHTKDLLIKLNGLSLLLNLDLNQRTLRFHDTVRDFLRHQESREGLLAQHKRLLQALEDVGPSPDADKLTRKYYYLSLPRHLAEAEERERLDALLTDPAWLQAKLLATGNPQALVADYEQLAAGEAPNLIGRTLRLIADMLARDPRQLIPQLLGRLMGFEGAIISQFLKAARSHIASPVLLTERPSLTPPGAESTRLEGHSGSVIALCQLQDGRLASGSTDNTILVWDVGAGVTARLKGHVDAVKALCPLQDGRLASGSDDETIRIWELKTGSSICLRGHSAKVNALSLLPDGRLASGSGDFTLRLWDLKIPAETDCFNYELISAFCLLPRGRLALGHWDNMIRIFDVSTRAETDCLSGHTGAVRAVCLLDDGRLASGSADETIQLWDVEKGIKSAPIKGHTDTVTALLQLPDGRLASGSYDKTIRVWDVTTGAEKACIEGHSAPVAALCLLSDGRLASGSWDRTIRLWDLKSVTKSPRLGAHSGPINAVCLLPDNQVASASSDETIRIWDVNTGTEIDRLKANAGEVSALCVLSDHRLASAHGDNIIRLWDVSTRAVLDRLEGHFGRIAALRSLPDGSLASGSHDHTVRLWDVNTGAESVRLEGHNQWVSAVTRLPDGRLASASRDIRLWRLDTKPPSESGRLALVSQQNMIRPWEAKPIDKSAFLDTYLYWVGALCVLPDKRLASGSYDGRIRLWDVDTGAECSSLEGHSGSVNALCLHNGRLVSGGLDKTIRLWSIEAGRERARLEVDAPVLCLAGLLDGRLVAGDAIGRLHWLKIID